MESLPEIQDQRLAWLMEISILMSNSNSGSFPQLSIYNGRMLHVFSICATMLGLLFIWAICLYIVQTFVWLWLSPSEESCLSSKSLDETCMPKMGIEFVEWISCCTIFESCAKGFWKVLKGASFAKTMAWSMQNTVAVLSSLGYLFSEIWDFFLRSEMDKYFCRYCTDLEKEATYS